MRRIRRYMTRPIAISQDTYEIRPLNQGFPNGRSDLGRAAPATVFSNYTDAHEVTGPIGSKTAVKWRSAAGSDTIR